MPTIRILVLAAVIAGCAGYADLSKPIPMPDEGFILSDDGLRLAYRIIGHGRRTVVVPLIHWNTSRFASIAGEDFRFLFYDPRNRGASDASPDPDRVSFQQDMRDLDTVIRWTREKRVCLIGTSYYGGLVAGYAMTNPGAVDRVVMVGALPLESSTLFSYAPSERSTRVTEEDRQVLEELRQRGLESTDPVEYCRRYWALESRLSVGAVELARTIPLDRCALSNEWPRNITSWSTSIFGSLGEWNWTAEANRLRAPTLLIHGTHDLRVPLESSRQWSTLAQNARFLPIEGAGHSPWWDTPETIFPAVQAFLLGRDIGE